MKRLLYFSLLILLIGSCADKKNYSFRNNTLTIDLGVTQYEISALSPDVIKVVYTDSLTKLAQVYAPLLKTPFPSLFQEADNKLILSTENVALHVTLMPFTLEYFDRMDGIKTTQTDPVVRKLDSLVYQFDLQDSEKIYGTGGRALPLNRRGYRFSHYNQPQYGYGLGADALNYSIPHIMSSANYMILFDNPARSIFDIGYSTQDKFDFISKDGNSTYYFINGDNPGELLNNYVDLTGHQDLPPMWAFGNLLSRFGYRSQNEAEAVLDKTLAAGYPVDAIVLDIYWFGPELEDGKMGQFDWDYEQWPEPKKMIDSWREKGVNTISVTEPFFTKKSKNYKELVEKELLAKDSTGSSTTIPDFYFGEAGLLDIFKPAAKDWIWEKYKVIKSYGVSGFWVDLGEPEKHPDYMVHVNGKAHEVHGIYGHEWAKTLYQGYAKDYPNERMFHMGRAGFAGSQRYGLIPWSGDVSRSWSGLQAQPAILMSMALSGLGYMHSDAGGFSMAERDEELYIRWLQFATFTPIFRPHADAMIAPEPVFWSDEVQKIVKPYIELRYSMLLYNYSLAWENKTQGLPLMRPMFFYDNEAPDWSSDQYFWGKDLLVIPVLAADKEFQKVHLPKGVWYNFWVNGKATGGTYDMRVSKEDIPVFVRAGAFIPQVEGLSNTKQYKSDNLNITYYLSEEESTRTFYFDDGNTKMSFDRGAYELLHLRAIPSEKSLVIKTKKTGEGYHGSPESRRLNMRIVGLQKQPYSVGSLPFQWDGETLIFSIKQGEEVEILWD
ncbi:MAG: oligosaccharide 4-alpha-D-glucosyltransferase [Cyclobacteriaceae bacterium]|jgi:alpha-glucosidase (family GH31 glycosyl hydrolase)